MKISRIDLFPARYPMKGYFKFFEGPRGARGRAAITIRITTDDGQIGWGQSVPIARWSDETLETAIAALQHYFAPAILGLDPQDIDAAHHAMDQAIAPGFSTAMPITRAGIDLALHDLAGRAQSQSIADLWGNPAGTPHRSLKLSWTVNARNLDEAQAVLDQGRTLGYQNFNIKVGDNTEDDIVLAKLVRQFAPDGFLWADANGGYEPDAALDAARKLADVGVDVLESPCRPNRLRAYQTLKRLAALPILMDEGVISPVELNEFIALNMIDGVAMKHARCAGLKPAKQQIDILRDRGLMWLGSGLTDPDISLAAALALYSTCQLDHPAALNGPQFLDADCLHQPLTPNNGRIDVPQGPGLGIAIDETKVHRLTERSSYEPITIQ